MSPDHASLLRYAETRDEAAFAEVVRRHVDMVYSTALRLVAGDTHLAQDVAQSVFTDLARKAGEVSRHPVLGGWLHTATRFAAAKAVSREQRRRELEHEASAMQNQITSPDACWEQLQPLLDEAIGSLGEPDRDAVVLRFFENKSHREVGEAFGVNEDTARKRVERAVEKLRAHFSRRGVAVSSGALAAAVSANSVQAAPAHLASAFASAATVAAGAGGTLSLLKSSFFMNNLLKIALASLGLAVVVTPIYYFTRPVDRGMFFARWAAETAPATESPVPARPSRPAPAMAPPPAPRIGTPAAEPAALPAAAAPSAADAERAARLALAQQMASGQAAPRVSPADAIPALGANPTELQIRVTNLIQNAPMHKGYGFELFELEPGSASSYRIRGDATRVLLREGRISYPTGVAYYIPGASRFYIQWDSGGSSVRHYYGPFDGDPREVLQLPQPDPALSNTSP